MVRSAGGGAACGDGSPGHGSNPGAPGFLSPGSPGLPQPSQWVKLVNRAETQAEWDAMRLGVQRSQPLGSESWVENTARVLGLESTMRPRARPRKQNRQ